MLESAMCSILGIMNTLSITVCLNCLYDDAQAYIKNTSPQFQESYFMNFSPTMKTYHLPDSGGSYISRYRSISSWGNLGTRSNVWYVLCVGVLTFSIYSASTLYHLDNLINSIEQARRKFKRQKKSGERVV